MWRMMQKPSRQGMSSPRATASSSPPGDSGSSAKSTAGSQSLNGVPSSTSASAASSRSHTCPRPKGRAAGNNSAQGHSASSTSAPRACGSNQRSRNRLQCDMAPRRSSSAASQRAQQRAGGVERQIHVGGHAPRQIDLQKLHAQRQQRPGQCRHRHGRARPARAQQGQRQQKAEGRVAGQVQVDVKPGPVRRRHARREEHPGRDALLAPALEGKQAGKDDQRGIDERQGPGRCLVHGAAASLRKA